MPFISDKLTHFFTRLGAGIGEASVAAKLLDGPITFDQSGEHTILLSAATNITARGLITGLTALAYVPVGVVRVYCFAQAGLPAGLYYARFSSTTSCQLFLDAAGTVMPIGITAGAYLSSTADAILRSCVVPGGMMGPHGALNIEAEYTNNNSANGKSLKVRVSTTDIFSSTATNLTVTRMMARLRNRGSENLNYFAPWIQGFNSSNGGETSTIDTRVPMTISFVGQLGSTADIMSLESCSVEMMPS